MTPTEMQSLRDLVEKAKTVLIVTHERPTADSIGSSLSLYLALQSLGKTVSIACPEPITVDLSHFVGANKVISEIGKKNFVISLDYVEGSIEKVSYNIEGNKFNLVIEPREGFDGFSKDKVQFLQKGATADVIFSVDTIHLGGLKKLFEADKDLFSSTPIINVDRHPNNTNYGKLNIVQPQASATIEIVAEIIAALGITLSQDIATNILNALYSATNNFTSQNVTPKAFELAAESVKIGAKRFRRQFAEQSEERPLEEVATSPLPEVESSHSTNEGKEAPPDWLKPKIFKSSNLG